MITIPAIAAILGLILFYATDGKHSTVGLHLFWTGALAYFIGVAGKVLY